MRKEYLALSRSCIGEEEISDVVSTLRADPNITGSMVKRFEKEFAAAVDARAALALSSCTTALHLALVCLRMGPGDAVLTAPMTFCSGVHVIEQVGARPVLVDADPDTLNIDPAQLGKPVKNFSGSGNGGCRLKAILPVHLFGHPCEMDSLMEIARGLYLAVIEDAMDALSTKYKGRVIGSWTTSFSVPVLTCFSLYATNDLTTSACGMLTGSIEAVREVRLCSFHGTSRKAWKENGADSSWRHEATSPGFKYNMSDLQAAIDLCQLAKLSQFRSRRAEIARRYNMAFSQLDQFQIPTERNEVAHAWNLYVLRLNLSRLNISRDTFIKQLRARNISSSVHFTPIHLHPYYRNKYGYKPKDFLAAYHEYQRIVSLPLYPRMTDRGMQDVIEAVTDIAHKHNDNSARGAHPADEKSGSVDAGLAGTGASVHNDSTVLPDAGGIIQSSFRRVFDLTCATLGLVILAPLFLIVIAAIRLEGEGPVFFSQQRVGKGLEKFRILKFRTMFPNSGEMSLLTAPQDPRVTRVGRYLRKYKVDELPQLVNVMKGEMQLVGVRPQVECFVEAFPREYGLLLQERPGITDPATIAFRHEELMFQAGPLEKQYVSQILPRKLSISLKYRQGRSFFSDLGILVRTVLGSKNTTTN